MVDMSNGNGKEYERIVESLAESELYDKTVILRDLMLGDR